MVPLLEAAKKLCENGSKTHMENPTAFVPVEMQLLRGFLAPNAAQIPTKRAVTLSGNAAVPGEAQC